MTIQLAPSEQHYLVNREGEITLVNEGPELIALLARDLQIKVDLVDYENDPLPQWVHKFNTGDQTFFTVDISNGNHEKSFRNIKKPFFVMRIQVFVTANADPEPHFVAFIIKGDYYYIYGGEECAQIYRLHEGKLSTNYSTMKGAKYYTK